MYFSYLRYNQMLSSKVDLLIEGITFFQFHDFYPYLYKLPFIYGKDIH
jgi:hypothetical protein